MSWQYKCLALISQWSYFSANRRDFFMAWIGPDYRQVWRSICHGDTCLAQFSLVLSRSCQPNYRRLSPWLVTFMSRWLASFFMAWIWPMSRREFSYGNYVKFHWCQFLHHEAGIKCQGCCLTIFQEAQNGKSQKVRSLTGNVLGAAAKI